MRVFYFEGEGAAVDAVVRALVDRMGVAVAPVQTVAALPAPAEPEITAETQRTQRRRREKRAPAAAEETEESGQARGGKKSKSATILEALKREPLTNHEAASYLQRHGFPDATPKTPSALLTYLRSKGEATLNSEGLWQLSR